MDRRNKPFTSSAKKMPHPQSIDVIIVGAGVAGSALAHTLGKDGRHIHLIERKLTEPKRIAGELLQPGGYLKLIELGLEDCVNGIDAQQILGYNIHKSAKNVVLPYPVENYLFEVAGRSFHHGRFVQKMRQKAASLPNVKLEQGTVISLLEERSSIVGVQYKTETGHKSNAYAPLTIICDGYFSSLRKFIGHPKVEKPSHFVGLVVEDCRLPNPEYVHIALVSIRSIDHQVVVPLMDWRKTMLRFLKRRREEEECSLSFLENGSKLLEGLASASNCAYDIPYRNFTAKELINATSNFRVQPMDDDGSGDFFRGSFQQRQILVKRYRDFGFPKDLPSYINCDMVITLMMSHHRNVMKFLGCCLDFYPPAVVYEYADHDRLLYGILKNSSKELTSRNELGGTLLSWRHRLKIANDIGNALVYLHTAFATPIIHRDFSTRNIVIDQFGVAKLLNFSFCKILPPGESQVEDHVIGRTSYLDPEYMRKGIVTEKSDVYMFGVFLLKLLAGERSMDHHLGLDGLVDHAKYHVENNCLNKILDDDIISEERGEGMEQQLQAVAELALRCCLPEGQDRPNMIEVAKELRGIERSGCSG